MITKRQQHKFNILLLVVLFVYMTQFKLYLPGRSSIKNYFNPQIRIYCFILTAPQYFDTRARAVNLTWAPRCDKFSFISEYSNNTKGLPIAPIANILSGYDHLTQKTTSAWHYVHENFLNDYDWFVKADDNTYIFVENLKLFLKEQNTLEPITFGHNNKVLVKDGYHSGGAGYVLSREALKRFNQAYQNPNKTCWNDGSAEDVQIAKCLRGKGVYQGKSVDKYNRERFHYFKFYNHLSDVLPEWFYRHAENQPVTGLNCCSDGTISFHYVTPEEQYLIDKVRYGFHGKA